MGLVNAFDKMRFWDRKRNRLLNRLKVYGALNRLIDLTANAVLPVYFRLTATNPKNALSDKKRDGRQVIVSLTSFPKRIPTLWLVIETLLRQTVKPDRIVLYLTASQVPDIEALPKRLLDQRRRGLEIRLCPDEIRSHTKYYYAMQEFPEDTVITVDDDLFYRDNLVETHLKNASILPECIIANWVKEVIPGKYKYTDWPDLHHTPKLSRNMLVLGVGSVLYPPHSIHHDAFDVAAIRKLTLTADDVWLSAMLLKQGTPVYFTGAPYNHLPVMIRNNETLISGNYVRNQQCVDAINEHYRRLGQERPFIDIPKRNAK